MTPVTLHKRRTTSNSGNSAKSRKKATSSQKGASSATAPASFEQVFGKGLTPELDKLRRERARRTEQLQELKTLGEPRLALYKARHRARLARLTREVKDIDEAIDAFTEEDNH